LIIFANGWGATLNAAPPFAEQHNISENAPLIEKAHVLVKLARENAVILDLVDQHNVQTRPTKYRWILSVILIKIKAMYGLTNPAPLT
jgi:hypothetical protein